MKELFCKPAALAALFLLFVPLMSSASAEGLVLAESVSVPYGMDYVDMPVVSAEEPKTRIGIGYGIYFESWQVGRYVCRIHLAGRTRELKKGTIIVLDGRQEKERTKHGMYAHKFFVKEPKEVEYICCGVYVDHYRSLMGEKVHIVARTFPEDFR